MMGESTTVLFSKELDDLHDDGLEGSIDEHRIFSEVFFGKDITNKGFVATKVVNFDGGINKQTDMQICSSSGNSSLTSQGDHLREDLTEKPLLKDLSSSTQDAKAKLRVGNLPDVKPDIGDTLITSTPSEGAVSGVSRQDSDCANQSLTYHLVESSGHIVKYSCYKLNQLVELDKGCEASGGDISKNIVPNLTQNDRKEAVSPISQESYVSKLLIVDPSVSTETDLGTNRSKKPRWKDHCFRKLDDDELALPKNIKNDPRPLLRYHVNRLFTAAGWVVGRRKRNSKYNGIGEYVYKSPEGRPFREFRKAWCLFGETLLSGANRINPVSNCMRWADMTELWTDLSCTINDIDDELTLLETTSAMARLWHLLDPFANAVFINKSIRSLKEGIVVEAKRSLVMGLHAESAARDKKVPRLEGSKFTPRPVQSSRYRNTCSKIDDQLFDDPVCSGNASKLLRGPESAFPHQASSTNSPILEPGPSDDEGGLGYRRRVRKKSRKLSEMELTENQLCEGADQPISEIGGARSRMKKLQACRLSDDDLLISAILKKKTCKFTKNGSTRKSKPCRKRKTPKGSCRLLPRSHKKGTNHILEGKWSIIGSRTVLSWLIHSGVVSLHEVIQYRNLKDDATIKDGLITRDGILCMCCNKVLSVSGFNLHAGFRLNRPCMNLFLESGKPLSLCQLEAWSAEYKARKTAPQTDQVCGTDQNDDSCGRCGDVGELICCDNCPSAFHQACLFEQELPEGNWYCPQCRCQVCGDAVDEGTSQLHGALKCCQCEHKYHETCMPEKSIKIGLGSDTWFCGEQCHKVYSGLQSHVGLGNLLPDGFSWSLLRCIPGDQKVHSAPRLVALKAECNSKLAVAITIMEECFLPMVDIKTGIDMIPQVMYNWGSQFTRLNYSGFYTVVLEKDDVLLSVASIRIHGVTVAELPLVATCSKNRRQGMCRRLINVIEEMLRSLKVEKLVVSAIPTLVETWTVGFGFEPLGEDERQSLSKINLMVFPGAVWLKKRLCDNTTMDEKSGPLDALASEDHLSVQASEDHLSVQEVNIEIESREDEDHLSVQASEDHLSVQEVNIETESRKDEDHLSVQASEDHLSVQEVNIETESRKDEDHLSVQASEDHLSVQEVNIETESRKREECSIVQEPFELSIEKHEPAASLSAEETAILTSAPASLSENISSNEEREGYFAKL